MGWVHRLLFPHLSDASFQSTEKWVAMLSYCSDSSAPFVCACVKQMWLEGDVGSFAIISHHSFCCYCSKGQFFKKCRGGGQRWKHVRLGVIARSHGCCNFNWHSFKKEPSRAHLVLPGLSFAHSVVQLYISLNEISPSPTKGTENKMSPEG